MSTEALRLRFDEAMFDIYRRAERDLNSRPTLFLQMLHKDRGVLTAKKLINAATVSEGYTRLFEEKRLDLTVEAVVADNPEWHPLFLPEEVERARKRLTKYNYTFKTSG